MLACGFKVWLTGSDGVGAKYPLCTYYASPAINVFHVSASVEIFICWGSLLSGWQRGEENGVREFIERAVFLFFFIFLFDERDARSEFNMLFICCAQKTY